MLGAIAFWIGKQLVLRQHLDRVQRELFRFWLLILLVVANLFGVPVIYEEKICGRSLLPTYLGFQ